MNLSRIIERWAAQFPSKIAVHFEGKDWTYLDLWQRIDFVSGRLAVAKGDRIAYLGYNNPEMLVLLFALARLGAILVPLNWRLTAAEHKEILADCAPTFLFCDAEFEEHARKLGIPLGKLETEKQALSGRDEDDLLIVYTAGTSRLTLGRRCATSASHNPGSKRLCSVTRAPARRAGSVWLFSPPTWNIGSGLSTWSACDRSWAWIEL